VILGGRVVAEVRTCVADALPPLHASSPRAFEPLAAGEKKTGEGAPAKITLGPTDKHCFTCRRSLSRWGGDLWGDRVFQGVVSGRSFPLPRPLAPSAFQFLDRCVRDPKAKLWARFSPSLPSVSLFPSLSLGRSINLNGRCHCERFLSDSPALGASPLAE